MLETMEDDRLSPIRKLIGVLRNLTSTHEVTNNKFRVVVIFSGAGFIPTVLRHLCAG
jgi:hypothetical protein